MNLDLTEEEERIYINIRYKEMIMMSESFIYLNQLMYNFYFLINHPILYIISWFIWPSVKKHILFYFLNLIYTFYFLYKVSLFLLFAHMFFILIVIGCKMALRDV